MDIVDVAVQITGEMDDGQSRELEESIRRTEGVISVHIHRGPQHVLLAEVNPQRVASGDILRLVRERGLQAELTVPGRLKEMDRQSAASAPGPS